MFFSADLLKWIIWIKLAGWNRARGKTCSRIKLVIVVPADSKLAISSPKDLLKTDVKRIALAEPSRSRWASIAANI